MPRRILQNSVGPSLTVFGGGSWLWPLVSTRAYILKSCIKAWFFWSTVGYGTQTPQSITGKAIGGFCAIVGVFILTLPVPIVVNSFASYYKNRLWRNEVAHKRSVRAAEQAELVKELFVNGGTSSRRPSGQSGHSANEEGEWWPFFLWLDAAKKRCKGLRCW